MITLEGNEETSASSEIVAQNITRNKTQKNKSWQRSRYETRSRAIVSLDDDRQKEIITTEVDHIIGRDPMNYGEAVRSQKSDEWVKAMDEELSALSLLGVFGVIKFLKEIKFLHSK